MMCKILIRNVSDPAPSIVLVYDLNLNSVWVRSDVHPVSLHFDILRRRRSGWECTQGSQWKLETGSHQKFGEPHFNATWPDLQLEGMLSQLLIIFSIYFQYIYIYVYYIYPYISYDFYTFYTWFIPTGPLQDLQVASRPRDHCLATSRGSLIDVERGLVQWRVELDQAKAGPFCDMMSPLTFFRILKGLKGHFKSKWICFNSNHIVIFNYRVQGCYIC